MPHIHSPRGRRALILAASASLALTAVATTVASADAKPGGGFHPRTADTGPNGQSDNLRTDLMKKHDAKRQVALQQVIKGKKTAKDGVVKMAPGQFVDLENEGTDKIFVVLVEFGDEQFPNPIFQGPPKDGSTLDVTGPLHNQIPEPDRSRSTTPRCGRPTTTAPTIEDMYFNRMAAYYETQSDRPATRSTATVTEWVKVPFNEGHGPYGRNYCGGIACDTSQVRWSATRLAVLGPGRAATRSPAPRAIPDAGPRTYLKSFDIWDRFDFDGDGNFNEPDGYIDHFQAIHAGEGEEAGAPEWPAHLVAPLVGQPPTAKVGPVGGAHEGRRPDRQHGHLDP